MQYNLTPSTATSELIRPEVYINRELSWIEFNRRVFHEARDPRHPLLERVKFLSIFDTNFDEFIMIRLAGLKDQSVAHVTTLSPDGRTGEQQLEALRKELTPLLQETRHFWRKELMPALAAEHIYILDYEQLDAVQRSAMQTYFENEIFPVLTPLAVDSGHPFPHISNRSLNLAVMITDVLHGERPARVKVPPALPRLIPVPLNGNQGGNRAFVWIEQVVAAHLSMLFPGFDIWESYPFRVLRDADIEIREDDSSDLLETIEQGLRERRFGSVVDLAVNPSMPQRIRDLLLENLELEPSDLTVVDGPLGMGDLVELYKIERPDLKYPSFVPRTPPELRKGQGLDIFQTIRQRDQLLHQPYESFDVVVDFLQAAARDPHVLAIKQTLYRVGTNSPIVGLLQEAVENGKQVAVLVELKARFDEENNIEWARALERAGVHVVYGLQGLKTHAKVALVVRREADGLHRYVHYSTGNYNVGTARIYEDLGLLTCRPELCADTSALFNLLTGYSRQSSYQRLLVAPLGLRAGMIERIEREIVVHQKSSNGQLIFKMNSLVDPRIIAALYRASQAGVQIDLIVRGMCCLRPGIPGLSETIRVRSIVGRFLEHSRIYYFGNGGNEEIFLGSADMMQRNLDGRVETLFPIEDPVLRLALRDNLLKRLLADTVNACELQADGSYVRVLSDPGEPPFDAQGWFITNPLLGPDLSVTAPTISAIPSGA
ncbi:MAG: polyphosphate kinase 1 [Ktedonobacteraceae bacterium]